MDDDDIEPPTTVPEMRYKHLETVIINMRMEQEKAVKTNKENLNMVKVWLKHVEVMAVECDARAANIKDLEEMLVRLR